MGSWEAKLTSWFSCQLPETYVYVKSSLRSNCVSVWFRTKDQRPWKGIFGFDRAINETRIRSFTCANFRAVFDSCSSFFAPEPRRNVCYAGYVKSSQSAQKRPYIRGTQREQSLNLLKHSIVERILVFKLQIQAYLYPLKMFHLFGFPS